MPLVNIVHNIYTIISVLDLYVRHYVDLEVCNRPAFIIRDRNADA